MQTGGVRLEERARPATSEVREAGPLPGPLRRGPARRVLRTALVLVLAAGLFGLGGIGLLKHETPAHRDATASRAGGAAVDPGPVVQSGTLAQDIASLQQRVRAVPKDPHAWASLGLAYVQQARLTADPSYYPRAQGVLARSMAIQPAQNLDALMGLAALAAARHDFAAALSYAMRGERIDPDNANIHAIAGDALVELGRYDGAFAQFQRAVDLRPDLSTYSRASYALELQGDVPHAKRALDMAARAAASAADAAWAHNQLGELAFNQGHTGEAEREYRDAVAVDPTFVPARAGLAKVAAARGDLPTAIAGYTWVVQRYPLPEYVVALGDVEAANGWTDQAARQYGLVHLEERLFRSNGVDMDLETAQFDADHGTNLSGGLAAAERVWGRRRSIVVADALAWELYANGRYGDALRYADEALRLGSRSALFRFHRGMIERALGDDAAARRDLTEALRINRHFSELWSATAVRAVAELRGGAP
jgi:tetratricopeptide (TPR) repeat protein